MARWGWDGVGMVHCGGKMGALDWARWGSLEWYLGGMLHHMLLHMLRFYWVPIWLRTLIPYIPHDINICISRFQCGPRTSGWKESGAHGTGCQRWPINVTKTTTIHNPCPGSPCAGLSEIPNVDSTSVSICKRDLLSPIRVGADT